MEAILPLQNVARLGCGHSMHLVGCQQAWLDNMDETVPTRCPLCRHNLPALDALRPGGVFTVPYVTTFEAISRYALSPSPVCVPPSSPRSSPCSNEARGPSTPSPAPTVAATLPESHAAVRRVK
jgi:hypothetical protein